MSSRWPDLTRLLLAALLEALWFGALAALLVAAPPAPAILLCWLVVTAAALLAAAARRSDCAASPTPLRYRLLLLAVGVAVIAGLLAVADVHGWREMVNLVARSAVFAGVSLELGLLAGRAQIDPERAFRRAGRAFVLVFAVVLVSSVAGDPLSGSGVLVALVVLAGLALVAITRVLATLRTIEGGRAAWRWTAGVIAAGLLALAIAALIAAVPAGGALAWLGDLVLVALRSLLEVVAYVIAGIGYLVLRGLDALVGALHLRFHVPELKMPPTNPIRRVQRPQMASRPIVLELLGAALLVVLALVAVRLLLRSFRVERRSGEEADEEEREQLARPSAEARAAGRRLMDRLARIVRRARPRTPVEAVRSEYRRLEAALDRLGHRRDASWSVRRYLGSLAGEPGDGPAAARLVTLYERARYAGAGVGWAEVDEFKQARRALLAAVSR